MKIYTDGSCIEKGKFGGYCAIIVDNKGKETVISGGEKDTTNNVMELMGIYESLKTLDSGQSIEIFSDSQYALNVSSGLYKAHKNQALVGKIRKEVKKHNVEFTWVKGHSENIMNEKCDKIACNESLKLSGSSRYAINDKTKTKLTKSEKRKLVTTIGIVENKYKNADWNELRTCLEWYDIDKNLVILHNNSEGLCTQVHKVIKRLNSAYGHNIKEVIIEPDYLTNEKIVDKSDSIIVLQDINYFNPIINYANQRYKDIYYLKI